MTVNVPLFIFGLLLLWFPRQWMRRGVAFVRRRKRSVASKRTEPWKNIEPGDPHVFFATEFTKFRNYIDLLRAGAGGCMLWGGLGLPAVLALKAGASGIVLHQLSATRGAILLVAVLIQAVRYEKHRFSFYPPIFFLAGLTIPTCGLPIGGFAFVLIWALNLALPNAQGFLTAYAAIVVVFGYFFQRGIDLSVTFVAFLIFLPVLLSLLAKRQLIIFTRKAARAPAHP